MYSLFFILLEIFSVPNPLKSERLCIDLYYHLRCDSINPLYCHILVHFIFCRNFQNYTKLSHLFRITPLKYYHECKTIKLQEIWVFTLVKALDLYLTVVFVLSASLEAVAWKQVNIFWHNRGVSPTSSPNPIMV